MKIFLSLGFKDKTENEVREEIYDMMTEIKNLYPTDALEFIHNYDYNGENRIECLGEAIKKMSKCDLVCFSSDYYKYNGCNIEREVCYKYDIPTKIIYRRK